MMMNMSGMGWMMGGGIVIGILVVALLVLASMALLKYIRQP